MIKSIFLFIVTLGITIQISAQDILLSVKKGTVTVDKVQWLSTYPPKKLNKTSVINSSNDAIILVRKNSKYAKIYCPCENLKYSEINQKINGQAIKSNSYSNVIFNKPLETEIGKQKGSVSRGAEQDEAFFINISDSALVFNTDYTISWRSSNELKYLEQPKIKSVVDNTIIELNEVNNVELTQLAPGWYELSFKASSITSQNDILIQLSVVFKVLTQQEKDKILIDTERIQKETALFGEDIYEIYLLDYLNSNKILGF
jgi:hypothetical protein